MIATRRYGCRPLISQVYLCPPCCGADQPVGHARADGYVLWTSPHNSAAIPDKTQLHWPLWWGRVIYRGAWQTGTAFARRTREEELSLFVSALYGGGPSLLYVHGPGG
ncbi:hypothetical protein GCM10023259_050050 [Thermocatellispora tengchongensis]